MPAWVPWLGYPHHTHISIIIAVMIIQKKACAVRAELAGWGEGEGRGLTGATSTGHDLWSRAHVERSQRWHLSGHVRGGQDCLEFSRSSAWEYWTGMGLNPGCGTMGRQCYFSEPLIPSMLS